MKNFKLEEAAEKRSASEKKRANEFKIKELKAIDSSKLHEKEAADCGTLWLVVALEAAEKRSAGEKKRANELKIK